MTLAHRIIRSEHFEINFVLTCLDHLAEALQKGTWKPDFDLLFLILHYIESFPETFHHPKEEDYLFKAIRRRSPETRPMLDQLYDERVQGVEFMNELRASLKAFWDASSARDWYCDTARRYVDYERKCIEREESTILPLSLQILEAGDWSQINTAFTQNDHALHGPVRREMFDQLLALIFQLVPDVIVFGST